MAFRTMQNCHGEWQQAVKRLYNRKNFTNYDLAVEAIRKLGYADFYKNATIVDAYSGAGVFSAALYNEIKPQKHIMLEPLKGYNKFLQRFESENIAVKSLDPFRWGSFGTLEDEGLLRPESQPYTQVHNQLLFVANLCHPQGEQLTAQYLNCITNRSWLEKYGRVRLLIWMRANVAEKLLANAGEQNRHRLAVQRESCCDTRVVFHEPSVAKPSIEAVNKAKASKAKPGKVSSKLILPYPALLESPMFNYDLKTDLSAHSYTPVTLVELTPKEEQIPHLDEFEYVNKMLFISRSTPLRESLSTLGPGGNEDLVEPLHDLLHKVPTELTMDEFQRVVQAFVNWPFRPDFLHDFYEESLMGRGSSDERHI